MTPLRTITKVAAAVLLAGTLLVPASSAGALGPTPQCVPDHCQTLVEYYSDATYTTRVGEYEDGPCGSIDWGEQTSYIKRFWVTC
jgi:hypothetical protein